MPFGGEFSARSPGEARVFTFDFFNDLSTGDTIASATTTLTTYQGYDQNSETLLIGSPQILSGMGPNSAVGQQIGSNANNPAGFVPYVVYLWTITALTANGDTLVWYEWIPVLDVV
jgi:hypothetical protein